MIIMPVWELESQFVDINRRTHVTSTIPKSTSDKITYQKMVLSGARNTKLCDIALQQMRIHQHQRNSKQHQGQRMVCGYSV